MNKIIHFLYKIIHGPYPCGRTKQDKFLCCRRKSNKFNFYLTKDKTEVKCRFCNSIKIMSNRPIDLDNIYAWAELKNN